MALVAARGIAPGHTRGRLSLRDLIEAGRAYLKRHNLPSRDEDACLEAGLTIATVGDNEALHESLRERLLPPRNAPDMEPETPGGRDAPSPAAGHTPRAPRKKREWGRGRRGRLELRPSAEKRDAFAGAAVVRRGESIAEFLRNVASESIGRDTSPGGSRPNLQRRDPPHDWTPTIERIERTRAAMARAQEEREALKASLDGSDGS
jgi:hypothetical protein